MKVMDAPVTQLSVPGIEVQLTVPSTFEQAVEKFNHIKVLLWFETEQPRTQSSQVLKTPPFDVTGPVLEYVAILKPAEQCYDLYWAFLEDFEMLKDRGTVPPDAHLGSFDFIEEDKRFMAWVV